ncbi:PP0621 family protein [Marinomonas epiphytica]
MIVRLIVFIAIFFIGWWLYRQFTLFKQAKIDKQAKQTQNTQENMVRCYVCQAYTPSSHAIKDDEGRTFCSQAHLDQHQSNS